MSSVEAWSRSESWRARGRVEQGKQLIIEQRHGHRCARHLERSDVLADIAPDHPQTTCFEGASRTPVKDVLVQVRSRPKPVDEKGDIATSTIFDVADDRVDEATRHLVGGSERPALDPRLAMHTHTDLHLVVRQLEGWAT